MAELKTTGTLCLFSLDFRFRKFHTNKISYALFILLITSRFSF